MVDPVTVSVLYFVAQAAVPILLERFSDYGVGKIKQMNVERLNLRRGPVNHDLERAARKAYLLSTLWLNNRCLETSGWPANRVGRLFKRVVDPEGTASVYGLRNALVDELAMVGRDDYVVPDLAEVRGRTELLVARSDARRAPTMNEVRTALQARLLAELDSFQLTPPPGFVESLTGGWQERGADGRTITIDWFDMIRCFVIDELKKNEALERAFNNEMVAALPGLVADFSELRAAWEDFAGSAMQVLERIDANILKGLAEQGRQGATLEAVDANILKGLAEQGRQGAMLDAVSALVSQLALQQEELRQVLPLLHAADPASVVPAVRELMLTHASTSPTDADLTTLLHDLRALTAFRHWEGALVAAEVEHLLAEYRSSIFVGRELELSRLGEFLTQHRSGRLVLTAPPGYGKTALLAKWLSDLDSTCCFVSYHFFSHAGRVTSSPTQAYQNLLRQLRVYYEDPDASHPSDDSSLQNKIFSLLRSGAARGRLVVVLDGLDEVEGQFIDPFPRELPDGVYVVVSGQANPEENPKFLQEWIARATIAPLQLHRLDRVAISEWLRRVGGDGKLAGLADDADFVDRFSMRSGGEPRFSHHLVEEMLHAGSDEDPRTLIDTVPAKFASYVADAMERLDALLSESQRYALTVLAVARGPLSIDEFEAIAGSGGGPGLTDRDLSMLRTEWQAARWLSIRQPPSGVEEWAFVRQHEATIFTRHRRLTARKVEKAVVAWCSRWGEHAPEWEYALRHYPGHLLARVPEHREGEPEETMPARAALYDLASDRTFAHAHLTRLPAEPDLPLRTIQSAIRAAAKTDDASAIVRFVLLHERRLAEVRQSPLEALERFGAREARTRADLATLGDSVVWHLLIAWELADGSPDDARTILQAMHNKKLRQLSGWREEASATVLAELVDLDPDGVMLLVKQLVGASRRSAFVAQIVERGQRRAWVDELTAAAALHAARALCRGIESPPTRAIALASVAAAFAHYQMPDDARSTLEAADIAAAAIDRAAARDHVLVSLSGAWARVADVGAARSHVDAIVDPTARARALLVIGRELAGANEADAIAAFDEARRVAQARGQWLDWESARVDLLTIVARSEPAEVAQHPTEDQDARWVREFVASEGLSALQRLLDTAVVVDPLRRVGFNLALAEAAALHGRPEILELAGRRAGEAASKVDDAFDRVNATIDVAAVQFTHGLAERDPFRRARNLLAAVDRDVDRTAAGLRLVEAEREAGFTDDAATDFDDAAHWAATVAEPTQRVVALLQVAQHAIEDRRSTTYAAAATAAQALPQAEERVTYLSAIADAMARSGDTGDIATLELSQRAAEALPDPVLRAAYLIQVADRQLSRGQHRHLARSIALAAEAAGQALEPSDRVALLARIAVRQVEAGLLERSAETIRVALLDASSLTDGEQRANLQSVVVASQLAQRSYRAALEVARVIDNAEMCAFSLWMVATALDEEGFVEQSGSVLDEARERCAQIPDPADQATAVVVLADSYSKGHGFTIGHALDRMLARSPLLRHADVDRPPIPGSDRQLDRVIVLVQEAHDRSRAGDRDGAAVNWTAAGSAASDLQPAAQRVGYLAALGYMAHRAGWGAESHRLLDLAVAATLRVDSPCDRAFACLGIVRSARAVASIEFANSALDHARRAVAEIADPRLRAHALQALTSEAPDLRAGLATLHTTGAHAAGTTARTLIENLMAIGRAQLRAALEAAAEVAYAHARAAAHEISDPDERPVLETAVREIALMPTRPVEAGLAASLQWGRVDLLLVVADTQVGVGHVDGATRTLAGARKVAEAIKHEDLRAVALADIDAAEASWAKEATVANRPSTGAASGPDEKRMPTLAQALEAVRFGRKREALEQLASLLRGPGTGADELAWLLTAVGRAAEDDSAARTTSATPPPGVLPTSPSASAGAAAVQLGSAAGPEIDEPGSTALKEAVSARNLVLGDQDALVHAAGTQQAVLSVSGREFLGQARAAADRDDRDGFEAFLVPCAYHPEIVAELCALVPKVYPRQVVEVAAAVRAFASEAAST